MSTGPQAHPSPRWRPSDIPFSLGFLGHPIPRGPHICQIYTSSGERMDAVFDFLRTALESGEQTFCISQRPTDELLAEYLAGSGVVLDRARRSGQFHASGSRDFYLKDGGFDPDRLITTWRTILRETRAKGSPSLWAIADVLPELSCLQGGTQLVIYESKLEEWIQVNRATIVCQYDARAFDACTIIDILRVHPLILANGRVADCPFFTGPDPKHSH